METFSVEVQNASDHEFTYTGLYISEEYRYEVETLLFKLHKQTLKDKEKDGNVD